MALFVAVGGSRLLSLLGLVAMRRACPLWFVVDSAVEFFDAALMILQVYIKYEFLILWNYYKIIISARNFRRLKKLNSLHFII